MTGEERIEDLIRDIQRKQLILPEFQRGYVWKVSHVRSYLTSLYRGYPTGSFLVWKTPTPGKIRRNQVPDSDMTYFSLILDGQQRLTSIYTVITGEPPPFYEGEQLFFNLYFNLLDETFSYWKPITMKGKPEWIPVTTFFKHGLARFMQERAQEDQETGQLYFSAMEKLQRLDAIRSYPYYIRTITEANMERVVEIFKLVNSSGTTLNKSDLALAHICSSWPEARQTFATARDRLAEAGFLFELDFFTRCTSTVATGSGLFEPLYRTPTKQVQDAWAKAERALQYLVNVLRSDAFIDRTGDLASDTPLVTLVTYLARHGGTFNSEAEQRDFLHWMYAALMWGRYSGSSETKLNQDLSVLDRKRPTESLRANLLQERGRIKVQPGDLVKAGVRSTLFPMTYIVARANGAVDWLNGQPLYRKNVGAIFGIEAHHIFPTSILYKDRYVSTDPTDKALVNEIANIGFLTKGSNIKVSNKDPMGYLREIQARNKKLLGDQFVPRDEALWSVERFEDFKAARRVLIADAINQFMDNLLVEPAAAPQGIFELAGKRESQHLERKASMLVPDNSDIPVKEIKKAVAKTMAAFLNTDGGTLLIGVRDNGSIVGIGRDIATLGPKPDTDGYGLAFGKVIQNFLGSDIGPLVELTFDEQDGTTVAVARCETSHRPVFLEDGNSVEFYVRNNNATNLLNVRDTNEYIKGHWPK